LVVPRSIPIVLAMHLLLAGCTGRKSKPLYIRFVRLAGLRPLS
jgi:hypothetical protein